MSYSHGGGIDRPLVITKNGVSIVPHQNWRGQFAMGTYADGPNVGRVSDCGSFPAQNCVPIQWPGERTTVYHELTPDRNIQNWFGSLVDDMRDATGQMYRRNRYYDPQTGQFTQPDPIGLAGGLNAYGFAEGDPVSYSDPYGLVADTSFLGAENGAVARAAWHQLRAEAEAAVAGGDDLSVAAGTIMLGIMSKIENSPVLYEINVEDQGDNWRAFMQGNERSLGSGFRIELDHTQVTDQSLTVRLAHEIGGALLGRRFRLGHDSGAMVGENAARLMKGCQWRGHHNPFEPGGAATPC